MANQNDRKCDDSPGNPEQQNEAHIMPPHACRSGTFATTAGGFPAAFQDGRPSLYRRMHIARILIDLIDGGLAKIANGGEQIAACRTLLVVTFYLVQLRYP